MADFTACQEGIKAIEAALGGPVEIVVNNAGITRDTTMHRMSFEQWNAVVQTNLSSCFNMCRAVIEGMRGRRFGRIVNIGSINGQAGQYGQVNYAAAKSGIYGFTKALAQEGASLGITVNAVAPGYVDTEMVRAVPKEVLEKIIARIPVGRLGKAEDISRAVLFLVADDAGFITGSTLSVNGGQQCTERASGQWAADHTAAAVSRRRSVRAGRASARPSASSRRVTVSPANRLPVGGNSSAMPVASRVRRT